MINIFCSFEYFSAYELWFKQILYEVDSVREIFMGDEKLHSIAEESMSNGSEDLDLDRMNLAKDFNEGPKYGNLDERRMLEIMNRMNRVVMILKVSNRYLYKSTKFKDV